MPVEDTTHQTTLPITADPEWKAGAIVLLATTTNDPTTLAQIERQIADAIRKADASPDLLNELGGIADALRAGETVTIEPGSVKAARVLSAVAKAEGGAS